MPSTPAIGQSGNSKASANTTGTAKAQSRSPRLSGVERVTPLASAGGLPDLVQIGRQEVDAEQQVKDRGRKLGIRDARHVLGFEHLLRKLPHLDDAEDRNEEQDWVQIRLAAEVLELVEHAPHLDQCVDEAEHAEHGGHHRISDLA